MKLYHYVHCPFCVRVRMALGLLNKSYESIVLPYNDEKTPVELQGVKMLPIFEWSPGNSSNESLDIIKRIDEKNILKNELIESETSFEVEDWMSKFGSNIHSLCMPYWMWTNEFDDESRLYFQKKKEAKRGPFNELILNKEKFLKPLKEDLKEFKSHLKPFYKSETLTIFDICLASHLWGMYIFPEFQFEPEVHEYLQRVKTQCNFEYHIDFWRTNNE